ncbi:DNA topoisomerase 6 subunit A-like [Lotus japonicus]|uniref:DNA topoisomerase 6 subunit A-like n=1 Tax=Lotus japonicus TaxID=34305 RepID=UPI00258909DB|nr:DNA topoisomerase 6 subunit A-like [Lotus japonicus]
MQATSSKTPSETFCFLNRSLSLFKKQNVSDGVLDDVACILGCTRSNLHIVGASKGTVIGNLCFKEDGDLVDCAKLGLSGKSIPYHMAKVTDLESDALFILLVEKNGVFMRLTCQQCHVSM